MKPDNLFRAYGSKAGTHYYEAYRINKAPHSGKIWSKIFLINCKTKICPAELRILLRNYKQGTFEKLNRRTRGSAGVVQIDGHSQVLRLFSPSVLWEGEQEEGRGSE